MTGRQRKNDPFRAVFKDLPDDANSRLDALFDVNKAFRQALAGQLQPIIRTLLQENPPPDDPGRKELAHRINYVLRDTNLAILDPESKQPSTLVAGPYRLMLQGKQDQRNRRRNVQALPPLELVEHSRQEPFLAWKDRIHPRDSDPERGR